MSCYIQRIQSHKSYDATSQKGIHLNFSFTKHTCAVVNSNEVWLCSSETSAKSCVSINVKEETTTPRPSLKSPHIHGNMVSINDTLIIIGGIHPITDNHSKFTDQVEFCDQKCISGFGNYTNPYRDWETLPSLPKKVYSGQVAVNTKSKRIYHFGGHVNTWVTAWESTTSTFTKAVYALEFEPHKWQPWVEVGQMQGARFQGQVVFDIRSEVFWLVGGTDGFVGAGIEKWSEETKTGEVIASDESFHRRQFSLILMEN